VPPEAAGEGLRSLDLGDRLSAMAKKPSQIARRLRARSTSSEDLLWRQLRGRSFEGLKFRRQASIAGFFPDFCCYELGLTIEIDGKQHENQLTVDAARREVIESHGFLELRFTNDEIKERLDWVIEEIRRAVDIARTRTPRPFYPRFKTSERS
jgi:very-short-patch-repair endonuclease